LEIFYNESYMAQSFNHHDPELRYQFNNIIIRLHHDSGFNNFLYLYQNNEENSKIELK